MLPMAPGWLSVENFFIDKLYDGPSPSGVWSPDQQHLPHPGTP